ncbi:alkene reductase [Novosphingobium sediminicola]|uniref:2,4-dienoyl-CoA reductase-like NADH-dependent reductase (Old Yellow Enzyme family) n=1 Tax=Novosphingobium sediminicola TaxID=563162 RepID=A0A7W6CHA2_9SPHN|nr:alkene reductase [Novosphingobium sediminicola]MBB3955455.1 2,4-dienoyl-CoA reductase-like NADH-dependent reductase (Old Yellow Enzyme family) [Novosphingobium sediminicola]
MTNPLLSPIALGDITAPNRILLAPLTRGRSNREGLANPLMAQYYAQRAGAGLLISEATAISAEGRGWPNAPGIWNREQAESWKQVTQAVHDAGGRIVLQLWHMGRVSHPQLHGIQPVSASATTAPGEAHTFEGKQPYVEARALETHEIPRLIADYENAARLAKEAGFDGVQLHGANGYLIDQFLRDGTNHRTDDYGGSIENRTRLLKEVTQALIRVWGAGRVSVRLSPNDGIQGVEDSDTYALFDHAVKVLDDLNIGFLEIRDPLPSGTFGSGLGPRRSAHLKTIFKGPVVDNADYTAQSGAAALEKGEADAISYGRPFITNPDLVDRIAHGHPWTEGGDPSAWYGNSAEGYTSFPPYSA